MSEIEDVVTVPWVGQTCHKNGLTIVVLSVNASIVENISEALIDVHDRGNYRWKLAVLRCTNLDNIIELSDTTGRLGIDFIIIALDISKIFCIERIKELLQKVHPDLRMRRVVFVNSSGLSIDSIAANGSEVLSFCKKNKLDMLNANPANRENAESLAQKLLNYVEVSVGLKTGIPNLNI